MREREVADLIKESTENKITTKTTWSSTLIDEFSDIDRFKEKSTNSTNFQHASIVLDGCVKVYSTRVESVVDEANKLIESVGRVKEVERPKLHTKPHPTIESNPDTISLKPRIVSADDEILEYLSRESKEGDTRGLLMHLLKWSDKKGISVLQNFSESEVLPISDHKDVQSSAEDIQQLSSMLQHLYLGEDKKHISPMFFHFTPDKSLEDLTFPTYAFHISYDNTPAIEYSQPPMEYAAIDYDSTEQEEGPEEGMPTEGHLLPSKEELRLSITPFSYVKGWAGPSHWKVQPKKKSAHKAPSREKKKAFIDFVNSPCPAVNTLFEKSDSIGFTPQQISERRANMHTLPPDYNIRVEDLYQMLVYSGNFYRTERIEGTTSISTSPALPADLPPSPQLNDPSLPTHSNDPSLPPHSNDPFLPTHSNELPYDSHLPYPADPLISPNLNNTPSGPSLLSRRLLQSTLRRARKNDIVKVKESLWQEIEKGETKVNDIYTSIKDQEVSVQFYLVSLLHLANEKNLRIFSDSPDTLPHMAELTLTKS